MSVRLQKSSFSSRRGPKAWPCTKTWPLIWHWLILSDSTNSDLNLVILEKLPIHPQDLSPPSILARNRHIFWILFWKAEVVTKLFQLSDKLFGCKAKMLAASEITAVPVKSQFGRKRTFPSKQCLSMTWFFWGGPGGWCIILLVGC